MRTMACDVRLFDFASVVFIVLFVQSSMINAQGMGDLFGALGGLMGELGTGDKCDFECSNGAVPKPNRKHIPTSNGCGSYGMKLETGDLPGITDCCDTHDICYDTCGTKRSECDKNFKKCLKKICKQLKKEARYSKQQLDGCKSTADLLYTGTMALGCNTFIESQQKACSCGSGQGRKKQDRDEF